MRQSPHIRVSRSLRRRQTLRLVAFIAVLVAAIWTLHWYFFQLPARAMPPVAQPAVIVATDHPR